MRLSTTGTKHDEAGCAMLWVWGLLSWLLIYAFHPHTLLMQIVLGIFCISLLIGGIFAVEIFTKD